MYRAFPEHTDLPQDVHRVFSALMGGSENHLRAFRRDR